MAPVLTGEVEKGHIHPVSHLRFATEEGPEYPVVPEVHRVSRCLASH